MPKTLKRMKRSAVASSARSRSSSNSEYPCDYLQMVLSKKKMRCICEALDIQFDSSTTKAQLCTAIELERPDLMRGWRWNVLRAIFRGFDLQNMNVLKDLILFCLTGVPNLYGTLEVITYLLNNKKNAVGHGLFAIQRQEARKIMGYDTRQRTKKSYEQEKEVFFKRKQNQNVNTPTPLYSQMTRQETRMLKKGLKKHPLLDSLSMKEQKSVCLTMQEVSMIKKYTDVYAEVISPDHNETLLHLNASYSLFRSEPSFYAVPKNDIMARSGKDGHVWFHARPLLELYHKKGWL